MEIGALETGTLQSHLPSKRRIGVQARVLTRRVVRWVRVVTHPYPVAARIALTVWRAARALVLHEGFELSGYAAFTAILAMFPFLLFIATLAGFLGSADIAERFITTTVQFAPREVVDVVAPVMREVLSEQRVGLLTGSILFTLWSASSGVEALRTLLNRSYRVVETRPIWRLRPQSILIVVLGAIVVVLLSVLIVLGPLLLHLVQWLTGGTPIGQLLWFGFRYGLGTVLGIVMLGALHLVLPNCSLRVCEILPGVVTTTVLWLIGAGLFSLYVEDFSHYNITYGSLGGIILTLLFFYMTGVLFAFGAELNAELQIGRRAELNLVASGTAT